MTKSNSKQLYDFYVKVGYIKAADNMSDKYPEFKQSIPKVEKVKKSE